MIYKVISLVGEPVGKSTVSQSKLLHYNEQLARKFARFNPPQLLFYIIQRANQPHTPDDEDSFCALEDKLTQEITKTHNTSPIKAFLINPQ